MKMRRVDIPYGYGGCHAASVADRPSEEASSRRSEGLPALNWSKLSLGCPLPSPVQGDAVETWSHASQIQRVGCSLLNQAGQSQNMHDN